VGIFPPGARWYLAIIATVALLCVAIHLSIQIYAQKQAETLIHQWGEESGIEIGSVRYHLLRNGLILQNIKLKRGTDSLKIKHMFIRANPKLLTGTAPKIGNIEISDFEAVIWNPESRAAWQNDRKLMRIWHATQSLSISGGTLSLQMKDKPHPPLKLNIVSLQQQVQKSVRKIAADFLLAGAPVTWHWSSPDGLQNSSKTSLSWQQVDSRLLTSAMGLNTTEGLLSGKVNWTISDKAKTNGSASIQGEVELNSSTQSTQQLNWSGKLRDGNWALDMQAKAWPVQAWAEALPVIAGRKLQHGLLDTQLHWQRKGGIWKLSTRQGSLKEVIYTNHNRAEEEQHAWKWGRIDFKDLRLNFSSRKLHTASIRTERSSMVFQLQEEGSSAPQQRHINKRHWDISSDKIDIEDMTLGVAMAHGKLLLPALKGRCNWTLDNKIAFNLRSMKQKEAQHTGLQQENHRHAVWRVKGEAEYKYGNINRSTFKLRGKDVELALLRPLIPLQSSPETPLSLGGVAGLNMDITIANGLWQAYGKASINSPVLAYAGDRWKAERVETKFGPVGMGLKTQKIDTLDAENWHYTTALQPLPAYRVTDEESSDTTPAKVSWWINDLRRNNWQADRLSWKNGKVSIGNSDLLWAEALDIEITQLKPEQWAKVNAQGQLGQGYGSLKGSWYALADTQRFRGKATLDNSLPFFLHNWMTASGIPRLIRGRLSAELSIKDGKEENSYNSHVKLTLTRAVTETPPPPLTR